jgi:hypothetical protein
MSAFEPVRVACNRECMHNRGLAISDGRYDD